MILLGYISLFALGIWFERRRKEVKEMASAIENLSASVAALAAAVDSAVTVINTPHATDAQVQAAADAVNAQAARLSAATTPAS